MKRLRRITVILPINHSYGRQMLRGIVRYARTETQAPWQVIHITPWVKELIADAKGDGFIVAINDAETAEMLARLGRPTINMSDGLETSPWPKVIWDNEAVGRMAAQHLLEQGHNRFAFVGNREFRFTRLRYQGFCNELVDRGLTPPRLRRRMTASWLRRVGKPAAVFAATDPDAERVLDQCHVCSVAVPREVAVLGVNNDDLFCELTTPPLSSVAVPGQQVGFTAAKLLDRMLAGEKVSQETVFPPVRVVARASSDLLATDDVMVQHVLEYIRDSASEQFNVADLVRSFDTDRRMLERRFQKALARTPLEVIHYYRLRKVRELLRETGLSVQEIARRCGYSNANRLTEAFRRSFSQTPGEYREECTTLSQKRVRRPV